MKTGHHNTFLTRLTFMSSVLASMDKPRWVMNFSTLLLLLSTSPFMIFGSLERVASLINEFISFWQRPLPLILSAITNGKFATRRIWIDGEPGNTQFHFHVVHPGHCNQCYFITIVDLCEARAMVCEGRHRPWRYVFPSQRSGERPMSENTVNIALRGMGYMRRCAPGPHRERSQRPRLQPHSVVHHRNTTLRHGLDRSTG
jgi:hypothetical protein